MTLGHNSSVIFYDCQHKPIGYEEERLSNIKSDSAYPLLSFEKVLSSLPKEQVKESNVFISHWFDTFDIEKFPTKYFNHGHFNKIVKEYNLNVIPLSSQFTHHDAHAYSTLNFVENYEKKAPYPMYYIVADGFGNKQEALSIYKHMSNELVLLKRVYGYENSLGLLYQYATSYVGLKENQDEYKFLGYEVMIKYCVTENQLRLLDLFAHDYASHYVQQNLLLSTFTEVEYDGTNCINFESLFATKNKIHNDFDKLLRHIGFKPIDMKGTESLRVIIGYAVQKCLEETMTRILDFYKIENVGLSGGCFLNVKLNNVIHKKIRGKIAVNPLCGDQGAAIGLMRKYTNEQFWFADLCYGKRYFTVQENEDNIIFCDNDKDFTSTVLSLLQEDKIVNIVRDDMEFGPRALCNTSTIANPTLANVHYINVVNNRSEVMPMAPVMLRNVANCFFSLTDLDRVIGSDKFMIVTHNLKHNFVEENRGIAHRIPLIDFYTSRPQIIDNDSKNLINEILWKSEQNCLINTSFNTHGRPILYDQESCIADFKKQRERDTNNRLYLVFRV